MSSTVIDLLSTAITVEDNNYTIVGFKEATANQVPVKTEDGELEWQVPPRCNFEKAFIGDLEHELIPTENHELIIPKAEDLNLGVVKGSDEIGIEDDGSLIIKKVPSEVISDLDELAADISSSLELTPLASSEIDPSQMEIEDGVLRITKVDSGIVQYEEASVKDTLDTLESSISSIEESIGSIKDDMGWKDF